jgi:hypothetical protein
VKDEESDIDEPTATPRNGQPTTGRQTGPTAESQSDQTHRPLWHIPEIYRQAMVNRQIELSIDNDSKAAEATAAFRALLSAEEQNLAEARIAAARPPVWELALVTDVSQLRSELLNNAVYLEFLRRDSAHSNAGAVCDDSQPRTLEGGQAPDGT